MGKITMGLMLVIGVLVLSGCEDSELEQKIERLQKDLTRTESFNTSLKQKNESLQKDLIRTESFNTSLEAKLQKVTKDKENLNKLLTQLRENNKRLNVSLAKSELEFEKKHKAELEAERKAFEKKKDEFKQEQANIEKEAYENALQSISVSFYWIIGALLFALLFVWALMFLNSKKHKKCIKEKEDDMEKKIIEKDKVISKITKEKKNLKQTINTKEEYIVSLEGEIKELETIQKNASRNQVVSKIEEYTRKREQKLNRLGDDTNGK